ncbi:MAG: hypothetical protein AAF429_13875, partial [Pseudomonadota bacterium]
MATLVLAAAGSAIGGIIGGGIFGISSAVIGQAIGATIGRSIDAKLFGPPDQTYSYGQIDSFRLQGSSEGSAITRSFGRVRVPGQIIWSSDFLEVEERSVSGGGGGKRPTPSVTT